MEQHQISGQDDVHKLPTIEIFDDKQWRILQRCFHLSTKELKMAKLVCQGLTNNDIAKKKLNRSVSTVRQHIKHIFAKTRVINRVSLLLRFIETIQNLDKEN